MAHVRNENPLALYFRVCELGGAAVSFHGCSFHRHLLRRAWPSCVDRCILGLQKRMACHSQNDWAQGRIAFGSRSQGTNQPLVNDASITVIDLLAGGGIGYADDGCEVTLVTDRPVFG